VVLRAPGVAREERKEEPAESRGDRYWRNRAYSRQVTISKFAAATSGSRQGGLQRARVGASRSSAGSVGPFGGRHVGERQRATFNLAGNTAISSLAFGIRVVEAGSEHCKEPDDWIFCEWSVDGMKSSIPKESWPVLDWIEED
jgi:hypothetical protein